MTALVLFIKSHVRGYARRDGTFVRPHEDKRHPASKIVFFKKPKAEQLDLFSEPSRSLPIEVESQGEPVPIAPGPDLDSYDKVLVGFSGGKDSIASVLALLENGVPPSKIELHHHDIDGKGRNFMDWPITEAYCREVAKALGVPIYFSWREGGFEREMLRDNQRTAPVIFEKPDGSTGRAGGTQGPLGTRRKFPQQSASLSTRWCSGALKVDVMASAIRNQDRFKDKRTLVATGERAEESANRAKYKAFEPHRTHSNSRHVDAYRPIHGYSEEQVWDLMRKHGIVPHPAYQLGYGRLSCRNCIFAGKNQVATTRKLYPHAIAPVAQHESEFGVTIHRKHDIHALADKGTPYEAALKQTDLARMADGTEWHGPIVVPSSDWQMPAGAFGEKDGPC